MSLIEIIITIFLVITIIIFCRVVIRMKGSKAKDEMFLYFFNKAFRNVGLMLFLLAGFSVIISYAHLIIFNDYKTIDELRDLFASDLKYFLVGGGTYLYTYLSFRKQLKNMETHNNREEK